MNCWAHSVSVVGLRTRIHTWPAYEHIHIAWNDDEAKRSSEQRQNSLLFVVAVKQLTGRRFVGTRWNSRFCFDSKLESGYLARDNITHNRTRNGTDWCCLTHRLHIYINVYIYWTACHFGMRSKTTCIARPLTHSHSFARSYWPIWCNFCVRNNFLHAFFFFVLRSVLRSFMLAQFCILHISNVFWAHAKVCMPADYKLNKTIFFFVFFVRCVSHFCCCRCLNWLLLTVLFRFRPFYLRDCTQFATDRIQLKGKSRRKKKIEFGRWWKGVRWEFMTSLFGNGKHLRILGWFWFIFLATMCHRQNDGLRSQTVYFNCPLGRAHFLQSLSSYSFLLALLLHI